MGMNRESATSQLERSDLACAHEGGVTSASNSRNDQGSLAHNRSLSDDDDVLFEDFLQKCLSMEEKLRKLMATRLFSMNVQMNRQVLQVKKRMHT